MERIKYIIQVGSDKDRIAIIHALVHLNKNFKQIDNRFILVHDGSEALSVQLRQKLQSVDLVAPVSFYRRNEFI